MVSRWMLWLSTLADPITEWWNVGPVSFASGPRDFWGAISKSHRDPLVTVKRLASYLWLPGKSALVQGLVLIEPVSIVLLKCLLGVFFYCRCIGNYLIDACKFLNITHGSLKSQWESWRNCSLSTALSVTEQGQCHFLQQPFEFLQRLWIAIVLTSIVLGSPRWLPVDPQLCAYLWSLRSCFFFSFVIDILFYLFSAKRVNDSFRSFKKKYLNCLKYWCSKCHNLEEEAWKLAFKLCLQRLHFFCIAGEQLLEGTSQRWKSSPKTSLQGYSTWLKATLWREYEGHYLTCAPWASQNLSTGFSGVEY